MGNTWYTTIFQQEINFTKKKQVLCNRIAPPTRANVPCLSGACHLLASDIHNWIDRAYLLLGSCACVKLWACIGCIQICLNFFFFNNSKAHVCCNWFSAGIVSSSMLFHVRYEQVLIIIRSKKSSFWPYPRSPSLSHPASLYMFWFVFSRHRIFHHVQMNHMFI